MKASTSLKIARLATTGEIERYLLKQVDRDLPPKARDVMKALAVLLGYPAPRSAIEELLGGDDLRNILRSLSERLFVVVSHRDDERYYHQHSIVREFYYPGLNDGQLRLLHQRAATYFLSVEDFITAAMHWHNVGLDANQLYRRWRRLRGGLCHPTRRPLCCPWHYQR